MAEKKERLDVLLVERGIIESREKAKTKAILNKTTAEATREINKESIAQEKEI